MELPLLDHVMVGLEKSGSPYVLGASLFERLHVQKRHLLNHVTEGKLRNGKNSSCC